MNPARQEKELKKIRETHQKYRNDLDSGTMSCCENELYTRLAAAEEIINPQLFQNEQLRKQASYWREKAKELENSLKDAQKASRDREAELKEKQARKEARQKALSEEMQNKSAQDLEEMEKSLLEKNMETRRLLRTH